MSALEVVFPPAHRLSRLPLTRDQCMLLLMAVNMLFLGVDTYLAHSMTGTIRGYEWIPIVFSPAAGIVLLVAGAIALRRRPAANLLACLVFAASLLVGALGTYFHLHRALIPGLLAGEQVSLLVWAPPALGPLAFCLTGLLGLSAVWPEDPVDSGRLRLLGKGAVQLLLAPAANLAQQWVKQKVDEGAKEVQMPAAAVAGAMVLLHNNGNTAYTRFRDRKGQQWDIEMARNSDGQWQVVEVKNIAQLLDRLEKRERRNFGVN
jgi:hypothetical protein